MSMATVIPAYRAGVRPRPLNAARPSGGSWPVVQTGVKQGLCSCVISDGTPAANRPTVIAATIAQPSRTATRLRPCRRASSVRVTSEVAPGRAGARKRLTGELPVRVPDTRRWEPGEMSRSAALVSPSLYPGRLAQAHAVRVRMPVSTPRGRESEGLAHDRGGVLFDPGGVAGDRHGV